MLVPFSARRGNQYCVNEIVIICDFFSLYFLSWKSTVSARVAYNAVFVAVMYVGKEKKV